MGRAEPLFDCPEGCGRSFNELALSKHAKVLFIINVRSAKKSSNRKERNSIHQSRDKLSRITFPLNVNKTRIAKIKLNLHQLLLLKM